MLTSEKSFRRLPDERVLEMIYRRTAAFLLAILLVFGSGTALAAPGDANDPLISRSYITEQFRSAFSLSARSMMDFALGRLTEKYSLLPSNNGLPAGSFSLKKLSAGENVNLSMGGSIILVDGSARLTIGSGTMINITTGQTVDSGGELIRGNRYMAAENTSASVAMTLAGSVALDGDAVVGEAPASAAFSDVPAGHWAFEYVRQLADLKIVSGRGEGKFDPDGAMTRADFVTILGRMHDVDTSKYPSSGFSDVANGQYYTPYVQWASDNGIVSGYGDGKFGPSDRIQRSQMALIVVRYARFAGIPLSDGGSGDKFADDAVIPSWAKNEVYTARNSGLINGVGGNAFAPSDGASRAQVCAIISRLLAL